MTKTIVYVILWCLFIFFIFSLSMVFVHEKEKMIESSQSRSQHVVQETMSLKRITLYSGGQAIRTWETTSDVIRTLHGYEFENGKTLTEISGTVVIEIDRKKP